jgi:predicted nucleic acid-binding protein
MEKKIKLYLDTSVISALFDDRNPGRQNLTEIFFSELKSYSIYISTITLKEIEETPDEKLRKQLEETVMGHWVLSITDDIDALAKEYIKHGAIPERFEDDAYHIAIAVINEMDYLLSWNFKHLVREKTRETVRRVNTEIGLRRIEILTPAEIL